MIVIASSYIFVFFFGFVTDAYFGSKIRERSFMEIEAAKVISPLREGYELLRSLADREGLDSEERKIVTCYLLMRWDDARILAHEYEQKEYLISDKEGKDTFDLLKHFLEEMNHFVPEKLTPKQYQKEFCGWNIG